MKLVLYHALVALLFSKSTSFQVLQVNHLNTRQNANIVSISSGLSIVSEFAVVNVAVAVVSAAAGAATQIPKIQELEAQKYKFEEELKQARSTFLSVSDITPELLI